MPEWSDYQEEVAQFFRDLGMEADTNVRVEGVRTSHSVDVVVHTKHGGIEMLWLVECKQWKTRVPKEKVLALRTIVDDTGADRGFLMAEKGHQAGALEAARLSNIMLTSIGDLREIVGYELGMESLRRLAPWVDRCRERYWAMDKGHRIDHDLRPDVSAVGYSGQQVLLAVSATLSAAFMNGFPVIYDTLQRVLSAYTLDRGLVETPTSTVANTPTELFDLLRAELTELERRLNAAEVALADRPDGGA